MGGGGHKPIVQSSCRLNFVEHTPIGESQEKARFNLVSKLTFLVIFKSGLGVG